MPVEYRVKVEELRTITAPGPRSRFLTALPTAFWLRLVAGYPTIDAAWKDTGISEAAIRRHLARLHIEYDHRAMSIASRQGLERRARFARVIEQFAPVCRDPIQIHGPALVTACAHAPGMEESLWAKAREIAEALGIHALIIVGDAINADYFHRHAADETGVATKPEHEYNALDALFAYLRGPIRTVYWVKGNHEDMILRALRQGIEPERLRGLVNATGIKLILTWHSYMFLDDWRLTHCRNYSRNLMQVTRQLQAKYIGQKIAHAHSHRMSLGYSDGGVPMAEIPGMHAPKRLVYLQRDDTTHPEQNGGFYVYWQHNMIPYAPGFTDNFWREFLAARERG